MPLAVALEAAAQPHVMWNRSTLTFSYVAYEHHRQFQSSVRRVRQNARWWLLGSVPRLGALDSLARRLCGPTVPPLSPLQKAPA